MLNLRLSMRKINLNLAETNPNSPKNYSKYLVAQKQKFDFLLIPAIILLILPTIVFVSYFKLDLLAFLAIPALCFECLILIAATFAMLDKMALRRIILIAVMIQNLIVIGLLSALLFSEDSPYYYKVKDVKINSSWHTM